MQFIYHKDAKVQSLEISGELYNYLFRVRRHKVQDILNFRNLNDNFLYFYKITHIDKKKAILTFVNKEKKIVLPKKYLELIWCIIDPKSIEKSLPLLNEIGVSKITFVYCDKSQKNFNLKLEKLQKILINSSQQCGRSSLMKLEVIDRLDKVIKDSENLIVLDFSKNKVKYLDNIRKVLIGPEGGFSESEKELFKNLKVLGFDTPLILRSQSASIAISAKILL